MRATLAVIMTLILVAHIWIIDSATAYEVYKDVAYVRGYLGYFVASALPFLAGAIASHLVATARR